MPEPLLRLLVYSWNGLPIASLAIFACGGLMYLVLHGATPPASTTTMRIRRPGWIARRRARGGMRHPGGRVAVGYRSATGAEHLTIAELAGHGLAVGGPKSGKTTFLRLLIEAQNGRLPIVVIDPKASKEFADTVRALGGQVWRIDGKLPTDLLDPRPWQVPDLLLEAEDYSPDARVYRDAAHQRALWAAWSLALDAHPMDLAELRRRLDREVLTDCLERHRGRDTRIAEWIQHLEHQHGGVEDSGARGLDRALGTLLDGPALRGSLRSCPEAIRLEDVIDTRGLVLFSLDEMTYPHGTRKIAAWVLLAMGRLARTLPPASEPGAPRALLIADEIGAMGGAARHLRPLVGRAREAGLAVVMATQGLTDLRSAEPALVDQVLQDTAWQLGFRQGGPADARMMQDLFGMSWVEDIARSSNGVATYRQVERPRVPIDEWMNGMHPGDAWLRVAPIDGRWRQVRVRVALPRPAAGGMSVKEVRSTSSVNGSVTMFESDRHALTDGGMTERGGAEAPSNIPPGVSPRELPDVPPHCPPELLEKVGADVLARVEKLWPKRHHELGPCLVWTGAKGPDAEKGPYGRLYDAQLGKTDYVHKVVWRRVYPDQPIERGQDVDHKCEVTLCARPDHLRLLTKAANVKRRGATRGPTKRADDPAETQPKTGNSAATMQFAIARFVRIDRPQVSARTVSLGELVRMLNRFEVLDDKRFGRCWSPTKYADGATSRGNAGVEAVSALVFDCDRVLPDPKRLEGVYWIGHTTWSHKPQAPRWRVVIPLAYPVPAQQWSDVWRRARAALCPEADPACKDPSRAYWLPSHDGGVSAKTRRHEAPLLDPSTLPTLPVEPRPPSRQRTPVRGERGQAYMAQVLDNLAATAPGDRNAALNHAAWTLGGWIAAGALEQAEVEDGLYAAAARNGLVGDDGERQTWSTIRSGLSAGLQQAADLDAKR
ncbi:MAG: HNH endonuclease [Chloroflexi bacterium]|nr:HNH endonuclease [Chloroflexota bacterium]MBV9602685.1 HNH endonuclease [Chloroflexota bacterium]